MQAALRVTKSLPFQMAVVVAAGAILFYAGKKIYKIFKGT